MAQINGFGPENKGPQSGRGLGCCQSQDEVLSSQKLGKGMGLRRNAGGGNGRGKRLKSGIMIVN